MIPLAKAREITGHPTASAFRHWVTRFNKKNPDSPIIRTRWAVEKASLMAALEVEIENATPGLGSRRVEVLRNLKRGK